MLVYDDGPRIQWRLAVVEDLIHGGDGLVRAANIRPSTGLTNRPIVRLIPLEVSTQDNMYSACSGLNCEKKSFTSKSDGQVDAATKISEPRPVRNSAKNARDRMTQWANILSTPRRMS